MMISFEHGDPAYYDEVRGPYINNPTYRGAQASYDATLRAYENTPLNVVEIIQSHHPALGNLPVIVAITPTGQRIRIDRDWFRPDNRDAFKSIPADRARDVRNARLVGTRKGLDYGSEGVLASFLSGETGNAAQQGDKLREQAGVPFVAPDRKKLSGGKKTRRRRRFHTRKNKKHY